MWLPYELSHLTGSRRARNDALKIENNKTQQPGNTANSNQILSAVIAHLQDARHPIHRVRILYSKFLSPKMCRNVHKSSLKIGRTRLTRILSLSNMPVTPEGHPYVCARGRLEIVWRHKHANEALTFPVFPSVNFCESLYASWYRCLLHNIIFWQNFI